MPSSGKDVRLIMGNKGRALPLDLFLAGKRSLGEPQMKLSIIVKSTTWKHSDTGQRQSKNLPQWVKDSIPGVVSGRVATSSPISLEFWRELSPCWVTSLSKSPRRSWERVQRYNDGLGWSLVPIRDRANKMRLYWIFYCIWDGSRKEENGGELSRMKWFIWLTKQQDPVDWARNSHLSWVPQNKWRLIGS